MVLKKEIMKTQSKELEKGAEYRQMLVQARRPRAPPQAARGSLRAAPGLQAAHGGAWGLPACVAGWLL
jgi:hypothetical protein